MRRESDSYLQDLVSEVVRLVAILEEEHVLLGGLRVLVQFDHVVVVQVRLDGALLPGELVSRLVKKLVFPNNFLDNFL